MALRERPWLAASAAVLGLVGLLAASGFGAQRPSATAPGGWSKAITLAQQTAPSAVSCFSPGNCAAVIPGTTAYLLSEVHGKWGSPKPIPALAKTKSPAGTPSDLVCRAAGCVTVGSYTDAAGQPQAFILSETHGTWGKVLWVPGLASLDRGHNAAVSQLWCPSAGNCAATGSFTDAAKVGHPFVVSEVNGTWGSAAQVPTPAGLPGQASSPAPVFGSITCPAPGNCSAGGSYPVGDGINQLFVMSEVNGVWGSAKELPGTAALNTAMEAGVLTIGCAAPGNCVAGGFYWTASQFEEAFVANQVNGTWHKAIQVPGMAKFGGGQSWINVISCPAAGNCSAGGVYDYENTERPFGSVFVINEVNGTWRTARPVPGMQKLNNDGDDAAITAISCSSVRNCAVGGYYTPATNEAFPFWNPFVLSETNGTWTKAVEVPGTGAENTGTNASVNVISCTGRAAPSCAAAGYLVNNKTGNHAFVVSKP